MGKYRKRQKAFGSLTNAYNSKDSQTKREPSNHFNIWVNKEKDKSLSVH
jgi:hypothetical protein